MKRCHALTSGGYLIDYDAGEDDELTASFHIPTEEEEEKDKRWDVILMADPFEHLPSGIPNEKEISPRQPNALPKYALSVLPSGQTDGSELGKTLSADRPPAQERKPLRSGRKLHPAMHKHVQPSGPERLLYQIRATCRFHRKSPV
ncbi:hypothetical protein NXW50_31030 [Bacteroides thetaiotaomicron]|nr:hypothetical protein [Bacteroides thetaiotaomicron]MCS2282400.1 hypothetical protein [Bacteroides thetaiotaomicron]